MPLYRNLMFVVHQVITIDPSKHCHALKQIVEGVDDHEKHVEELTWQLNDDSCQQSAALRSSRISDDVRSKKDGARSLLTASQKLERNSDSCRITKMDKNQKESPSKSKSHISDDSRLQQHLVEPKSSPPSTKKPKIDPSSNKTSKLEKKKKQKSMRSETSGDMLSNSTPLKPAESEVKCNKKSDFAKSSVQLNGGQNHMNKEEVGIVSFADEAEANDSFPAGWQSPPLHVRQDAVYSEFESAVIDEYVDREPLRNVGKCTANGRRTDHDSSDEDVFDLIATGRINKITRRSQGSRSSSGGSQPAAIPHRTDLSAVSDVVDYVPVAGKPQIENGEMDGYDSASSADTDVIIRSHRLMSEVASNLHHQTASSFQPNPSVVLNTTSHECGASVCERSLNVTANVSSPSKSLVEDRCVTECRRRRKRSTSENGAFSSDDPVMQKLISTDENSVSKGSPEISHTAEHKRKQKASKVDDSEDKVKSFALNTNSSAAQATVSSAMPNVDDRAHNSRAKTIVSLLQISWQNMLLLSLFMHFRRAYDSKVFIFTSIYFDLCTTVRVQ